MTSQRRIRLFLDSNVLTEGIVSQWGLDKAALSLCAARLCKLVLSDVVRDEVEESVFSRAGAKRNGISFSDRFPLCVAYPAPEYMPVVVLQ